MSPRTRDCVDASALNSRTINRTASGTNRGLTAAISRYATRSSARARAVDPDASAATRPTEGIAVRRSARIAARSHFHPSLEDQVNRTFPSPRRPRKATRRSKEQRELQQQGRQRTKSQRKLLDTFEPDIQKALSTQKAVARPEDFQREAQENTERTSPKRKAPEASSNLEPWLRNLEAGVPPDPPDLIEERSEIMSGQDLSPPLRTETPSAPSASAVARSISRRSNANVLKHLQARNADPSYPTVGDPWKENIKEYIKQREPRLDDAEARESLSNILSDFANICQHQMEQLDTPDLVERVNHFFRKINDWRTSVNLYETIPEIFRNDVSRSKRSNEASLQRLVLPSILNHRQLSKNIDFAFEHLWNGTNSKFSRPGSVLGDRISMPKPDCAISFTRNAIFNGLPGDYTTFPYLDSRLSPEISERWFPFLFLEAKRADETLERTILDNMNSARHALDNVFICMNEVDRADEFYANVRVFSISMNAEKINARIYRALEPTHEKGTMKIAFEELEHNEKLTLDTVSTLMQGIVRDYAEAKLLRILQNTYRALVLKYRTESNMEIGGMQDFIEQQEAPVFAEQERSAEPVVLQDFQMREQDGRDHERVEVSPIEEEPSEPKEISRDQPVTAPPFNNEAGQAGPRDIQNSRPPRKRANRNERNAASGSQNQKRQGSTRETRSKAKNTPSGSFNDNFENTHM